MRGSSYRRATLLEPLIIRTVDQATSARIPDPDPECTRIRHKNARKQPGVVPYINHLCSLHLSSRCQHVKATLLEGDEVSDEDFENSVLGADGPVLVDFWAEWCGPCKMIGPALEEIADSLSDQLTVAKLNIDDNPSTPAKFGVRGIPTLMLFKDGDVAATKVGALPKSQLEDWVKSNI